MDPVIRRVAEEYGQEAAESPVLIAQVYKQLGAEERFAPDPQVDAWSETALGINPRKSAFTR